MTLALAVPLVLLVAGCGDESISTAPGHGPDSGPIGGGAPIPVTGQVIVANTCAPCHGVALRGGDGTGPAVGPTLAVVIAYTDTEFSALMADGVEANGNPVDAQMTAATCALSADDQAVVYRFLRDRFATDQ